MIYLLLTYYAFQLLSNSDLKFFKIRHYYQDSIYRVNIQVHTFALLLLCNPLPVLIHIIVDRNIVSSKCNFA